MGITIDKSITELEVLKKNTFSYMPAHQAFIIAIDTMRKYQKIEEIVNDRYGKPVFKTLEGIIKVVEDESNN